MKIPMIEISRPANQNDNRLFEILLLIPINGFLPGNHQQPAQSIGSINGRYTNRASSFICLGNQPQYIQRSHSEVINQTGLNTDPG